VKSTVPWREKGFDVIGSSNDPELAFEEIVRIKPDLVICDAVFTRIGGIGLMNSVKRAGLNCEFMLLTASRSHDTVRSFFKSGGLDYLLKPLREDEIEAALNSFYVKVSMKEPDDLSFRQG
jgi:two-component system response regulator YesN